MSKDNKAAAPATLEEALVLIDKLQSDLTASNELADKSSKEIEKLQSEVTASNDLVEKSSKELEKAQKEIDSLKAKHSKELDKAKAGVKKITKSVDGIYKSEKHGKTIKFKDGFVKTRVKDTIVDSEDLIKNKGGENTEYLDYLIEIGYGGIEEVK